MNCNPMKNSQICTQVFSKLTYQIKKKIYAEDFIKRATNARITNTKIGSLC